MSKRNRVHYSERTKPLIKLFQKLAYRHSTWEVFSDFLLMAACSISNAVDPLYYDEREKQYMDTVKKYSKEEVNIFPEIFAELVWALEQCAQEENMQDILGRVFHELELHNKWHGQFFTPQHVSDMMAKIAIGEKDLTIERRGFVTVGEPACGSGVMMISFAKAMQEAGYNYCSHMVADCTDIDLKCVHMCYIQLSLYGIPAIVRHGNTLSNDLAGWSQWLTPVYIMGGWSLWPWWKDADAMQEGGDPAAVSPPSTPETSESADVKPEFDVTLHESEHGQFSLF